MSRVTGHTVCMNVSQLIRQAREGKGLSQEALARAAEVSVSTVIRTEGGRLTPTVPTLFALARVLELDLGTVSASVLQHNPTKAAANA